MSSSSSRRGSMSSRILWMFAAITAIGLVIGVAYLQSNISESASTAATLNVPPKRTHVYALGRLEPAGTILQLVPRSGNEGAIVERLLVKEGDDVDAGATLAVLDNHARRLAALNESQARLETAKAQLIKIKAGAKAGDIEAQAAALALVEVQSKVADRELARMKELQKRNAATIEQIDQKQLDFDRLQLEARRAAAQLASLREIRDVDMLVAEKEIMTAEATVAKAEADVEASRILAPAAGRVLRIHTHLGERVNDAGVFEFGNVHQMQVVAEIFEADVAILSVGMTTEVKIDASEEMLTGRIVEIGNLVARKVVLTNDPVSDTDARVVEVRVQLDPEHLEQVVRLSNARVEVRIRLFEASGESHRQNDKMDMTNRTPNLR
jgi:HlyD family secretion protein